MIPVRIDFTDVIAENRLTRQDAEDLISKTITRLTEDFAEHWKKTANRELKQTRAEYTNSIYVGEEGKFKGVVILRGFLPNALENGLSPFDMKEGFKHGKKVKAKIGGGWYLTIPFRWAAAGSLGESSVFAGILPTKIHEVAIKKLGGKVKSGYSLKATDLPKEFNVLKSRKPVEVKGKFRQEYIHKSPIFLGLQRQSKEYSKTSQSQYISFRRVSDKSDPNSWIHTGIQAKKLADKSLESFPLRAIVDSCENEFMTNLFET